MSEILQPRTLAFTAAFFLGSLVASWLPMGSLHFALPISLPYSDSAQQQSPSFEREELDRIPGSDINNRGVAANVVTGPMRIV